MFGHFRFAYFFLFVDSDFQWCVEKLHLTRRGLSRTVEGGRDFRVAGEVNGTKSIKVPFSELSAVEKSGKIESKGVEKKSNGKGSEGGCFRGKRGPFIW